MDTNVNVNNIYNNNVNDNDRSESIHLFKEDKFIPESREELLALDIAHGLEDKENLKSYLILCKTYPEPILRRVYEEVKDLPQTKIKKSKGALFTYLIKKLCST